MLSGSSTKTHASHPVRASSIPGKKWEKKGKDTKHKSSCVCVCVCIVCRVRAVSTYESVDKLVLSGSAVLIILAPSSVIGLPESDKLRRL